MRRTLAPHALRRRVLGDVAGCGLLAYAAIEGVRSLDPGFLARGDAGRYVAAGAIAAAGLCQLSAPKNVCLRRCCERAAFLCDRWRPAVSAPCAWAWSTAAGASAAAGFAAFQTTSATCPFSGTVLARLAQDLTGYTMTKSALHFPVDQPLPRMILEKLIAARRAEVAQRGR